jgi:hypothetical protein
MSLDLELDLKLYFAAHSYHVQSLKYAEVKLEMERLQGPG